MRGRNPHSRFFRDRAKDLDSGSEARSDTRPQTRREQHRRLKALPEADVPFKRWKHIRRLRDKLCDHLGLSWRPKIRVVPTDDLERVLGEGTKGACTQSAKDLSADILVGAKRGLRDTLETVAHEVVHAVQIQEKGVGLRSEDEAEAERLGRKIASEYLRQARRADAL